MRGLFLSDIPSTEVEALRQAYDEAVALAPDAPMDDARVEKLFKDLGFDMKCSDIGDVVGVIDADGDGDVDYDEFMTGVGLMKKMTLLSIQLEAAFCYYKNQSKSAKREKKRRLTLDGLENNATPRRKSVFASGLKAISKVGGSSVPQAKAEEVGVTTLG